MGSPPTWVYAANLPPSTPRLLSRLKDLAPTVGVFDPALLQEPPTGGTGSSVSRRCHLWTNRHQATRLLCLPVE